MNNRVKLSRAEADAMLVPGDHIHTFITPAVNLLMGCDVKREDVLAAADNGLVELAGATATKMNHGVAWFDGGRCVFCATKETP